MFFRNERANDKIQQRGSLSIIRSRNLEGSYSGLLANICYYIV
jgi:hypothetical protein